MNKLRILLADNHVMLRQGLKLVINAQPDLKVIGAAGDGQAALQLALELQPDIVVMDVSMPVLNGSEATRRLKKALPQIKVLALSRHTDASYLQQLLRAGTDGYLLKRSDAEEVLHAIRAVIAGGPYLDQAIAGKLITNRSGRLSQRSLEKAGTLTEREAEVLRLIALGHSNKEIAARFELSVKTIEAHKANAMSKLELRSRVDIVRYATLCGWLFDN